MLLDITTYNWTTFTYATFWIAVFSFIGSILFSTFHQANTIFHHIIVNILFGIALCGIASTIILGYFLAVPQQENTLEVDNMFLRYDGDARDLTNDIVQPDVTFEHIFIHDGTEYRYENCILLAEHVDNRTAHFVVKCLSEHQDITVFGEDLTTVS